MIFPAFRRRPVRPFYFLFFRVSALLAMGTCGLAFTLKTAAATNGVAVVDLKLDDYLQQVMQHNESVQAQMLETEVARRKHRAEAGVFEPQLQASFTRESNQRTNNLVQQASQNGEGYFSERNNIYDTGLESLLPTGGKIRLGYTLSDLGNNVNPYGSVFTSTNQIWTKQYQTFVGATFVQPLLKDGGLTPTLAGLRLSALDSDIAFQQFRQQLMLTIFRAETAYWNLYFSQEQLHFFDQSVAVAQNVLDDSREKLKAGQGAELDVLEAQSALALRNTKRNDALQNYYDAQGGLQVLLGNPAPPRHYYDMLGRRQIYLDSSAPPRSAGTNGLAFQVVDAPRETGPAISYADNFEQAFSLNPDYLIEQEKADQERVRLGVAKNQLLPDLNFKAAYGYNGLGFSPDSSWEMAQSQDFPSWSIGVELSVPLAGNIKGRNLYQASKISLDEADVRLKGVQTEIANGLNTAIQKADAWEQSIQSYQMVVHFNEELLKTQLERLKAGQVDGHKVLEVEADLLDARQELANALTQYQRALLQVELTAGTILQNRHLDLTRQELKRQTTAWLHGDYVPASHHYFTN
jgi:outer membrane protein TolC